MESVILNRIQLYELVWNEPMLALAKRYEISDVGLRKICIRLNIPVPQAGHWQKVKFGKKPHQLILPELFNGEGQITLRLRGEMMDNGLIMPSFKNILEEINNDSRLTLKIPEKLINPDKLIIAAKEKLSKTGRFSRYKDVLTSDNDTIDIRVSEKFVSKALRFMDTLIKALRMRGHDIQIQVDGWKAGTYAIVQKQKIKIFLRERLKRVVINNRYYNTSELYPGGVLFFRIEGENSREWTDGKSPIEENIASIIAMLELQGKKIEVAEEKRQKDREKWMAEENTRKELNEKRQNEFDDLKELLNRFSRWQKVKQLREYLDELEKSAIKCNSHSEEFKTWLLRARQKADWYDPLLEKGDEWLDGFDREDLDSL